MNVIVCLGDNNGLLFNNRRVSRDLTILNDIFKYTDRIYVDNFSSDLIDFYNLRDKTSFLNIKDVEKGKYYFNEVYNDIKDVEKLIVYFFNRSYPHDFDFIIRENYILESEEEFAGNSHDLITKKVYRCNNEKEV